MAISSDPFEDYRAQKSLFNTPVWDPGGILCPFEHNIVNPPRLIAPARIRFYYRTLQINLTQAAVSPCVFNLSHHVPSQKHSARIARSTRETYVIQSIPLREENKIVTLQAGDKKCKKK